MLAVFAYVLLSILRVLRVSVVNSPTVRWMPCTYLANDPCPATVLAAETVLSIACARAIDEPAGAAAT